MPTQLVRRKKPLAERSPTVTLRPPASSSPAPPSPLLQQQGPAAASIQQTALCRYSGRGAHAAILLEHRKSIQACTAAR